MKLSLCEGEQPSDHSHRRPTMASRCSPSRFYNVVKNFNEKQREDVENIGFGNLLRLNDIRLRRILIKWLLDRYSPQTRSFHIGQDELQVTKMDVALIMGLRVVGNSVTPKHEIHPVDHLLSYYRARCGQIDVKFLEKLLQTTESGDNFKRTFVLFTLCTLLAPKPRPEVSSSFLQCVLDTEKISLYAWGEFTLENLFYELDTYKREGHKYIGGCIILLQFWYYEHVQMPLEGLNNESKIFPRLSRWDGFRCLRRDKKECKLGGYGLGEIFKHISPTPDEVLEEEVEELLSREPSSSSCKTPKGSVIDIGDPVPQKSDPNEENVAPFLLKNTPADSDSAKETNLTVALELAPYKLSAPSFVRCIKKRKTNPDLYAKVMLLEHAVQEEREKNEELKLRLSALEKLMFHDSQACEDRFSSLEHSLEDQRSRNEELRRRLLKMEMAASAAAVDTNDTTEE